MQVEDLTKEALASPSEARALLADRLVESPDPAEDGPFHRLWVKEAHRRLDERRSGEGESIPGEEAKRHQSAGATWRYLALPGATWRYLVIRPLDSCGGPATLPPWIKIGTTES